MFVPCVHLPSRNIMLLSCILTVECSCSLLTLTVNAHLSGFQVLATRNNVAMNILMHIFWFYLYIYISGYAKLQQTLSVFQSVTFQSPHQLCQKVPTGVYSCHSMLTILVDVQWYHIMAIIYISLMTNKIGAFHEFIFWTAFFVQEVFQSFAHFCLSISLNDFQFFIHPRFESFDSHMYCKYLPQLSILP